MGRGTSLRRDVHACQVYRGPLPAAHQPAGVAADRHLRHAARVPRLPRLLRLHGRLPVPARLLLLAEARPRRRRPVLERRARHRLHVRGRGRQCRRRLDTRLAAHRARTEPRAFQEIPGLGFLHSSSRIYVCLSLPPSPPPLFSPKTHTPNRKNVLTKNVPASASSATIVRIPYIWQLTQPGDFMYEFTDLAIWSTTEIGLGIVASAVATLRPLVRLVFGGSSSSSLSSPRHSYPSRSFHYSWRRSGTVAVQHRRTRSGEGPEQQQRQQGYYRMASWRKDSDGESEPKMPERVRARERRVREAN